MARRRVVVTGLGTIAPVGIGVTQSWANIVAGKSGISRITRFDPSAFSSQIAGEVRGFDVSQYNSAANALDLQDIRRALRYEQWNVYGHSYGSRVALVAMRNSAEGIRSR